MASHSGDRAQDKTFSDTLELTLVIYSVFTAHTPMRAGVPLALQCSLKALWGLLRNITARQLVDDKNLGNYREAHKETCSLNGSAASQMEGKSTRHD